MIKLFVSDLDGTLLKHTENGLLIKPEDKDALFSLIDDGIEFAIATGRMDKDIIEIQRQAELKGHRVSQNGGFVHDKEGNFIHGQPFSDEVSKRLHAAIEQQTSNYVVTTSDALHVPSKTDQVKQVESVLFFPITESPDLVNQYGESIFPSKFSLFGETDEIVKTKELLNADFETDIESYLSDKHCVDILPKGISKALGLSHLMEKLNLTLEEVAVIGDSYNDISMLEMIPNSYVMSTADPEVQSKAFKVVDDVYEAINDLKNRGLL